MTSEPCVLREFDTLDDARKVLSEHGIRHIPIVDEDKHVIGLVTQRDVLAASVPESLIWQTGTPSLDMSDTTMSEIMIKNVHVIDKSDSLRQAALFMQEHKYGCLPVISDNKLVGIITDTDFVAIAINLLEQSEISEDEADNVFGVEADIL